MSIVRDCVSELQPPKGPLFFPQVLYEYGGMLEWYWLGKPEELGEKPVSAQICFVGYSDFNIPNYVICWIEN
jgi:hypothetical protein